MADWEQSPPVATLDAPAAPAQPKWASSPPAQAAPMAMKWSQSPAVGAYQQSQPVPGPHFGHVDPSEFATSPDIGGSHPLPAEPPAPTGLTPGQRQILPHIQAMMRPGGTPPIEQPPLGPDLANAGSAIGAGFRKTGLALGEMTMNTPPAAPPNISNSPTPEQAWEAGKPQRFAEMAQMDAQRDVAAQEQQAATEKIKSPAIRTVAPVVGTLGPMMAAGTVNPFVGAGVAFAQTGGDVFDAVERHQRQQGVAQEQRYNTAGLAGTGAGAGAGVVSLVPGGQSAVGTVGHGVGSGVGFDLSDQVAQYLATGKPIDWKQTAVSGGFGGVLSGVMRGLHTAFKGKPSPEAVDAVQKATTPEEIQAAVEDVRAKLAPQTPAPAPSQPDTAAPAEASAAPAATAPPPVPPVAPTPKPDPLGIETSPENKTPAAPVVKADSSPPAGEAAPSPSSPVLEPPPAQEPTGPVERPAPAPTEPPQPRSSAERIAAADGKLKGNWDRQRRDVQNKLASRQRVTRRQLEPFEGEPWADSALSGKAPFRERKPSKAQQDMVDLKRRLIEEHGPGIADTGSDVAKQQAFRDNRPELLLSDEKARRLAQGNEDDKPIVSDAERSALLKPMEPLEPMQLQSADPFKLLGDLGAKAIEKAPGVARAVKDATGLEAVPKLTRAGVGDEAVAHASASISVPHQVNHLLAKVFPDTYHDSGAMSKTGETLVKDNILGGYDAFKDRATKARDTAANADLDAQNALNQIRQLTKKPPPGLSPTDLARMRQQYAGTVKGSRQIAGNAKREALRMDAAVHDIENAHDVGQYEKDVQAAIKDPAVKANIDRWKKHVNPYLDQLFNEIKGVDPNMQREGRGRHTEARVNLLAVDEKTGQPLNAYGEPVDAAKFKPGDSLLGGSTRNPNARRDRFDRAASFTGNYSIDPQSMLNEALSRRWNEVTKLRLYKAMQDKGVAVIPEEGKPAPRELGGEKTVPQGIKVPETDPKTGATRQVEKTMWVKESAVRELRAVLNTDLRTPTHPVAKALTTLQLLSPIDVTAHSKNLLSVVSNAQGARSAWRDVIRKMPGLSTADAAVRIGSVWREVAADTPQIRAEISKMSEQGLVRPEYPPSGITGVTHTAEVVHKLDTATRIVMNRFFDNLVERKLALDSTTNRRNFVDQAGQYNRRLMGEWSRRFKDMGLSPFIVAGRNFNRQGRRALFGTPGFEATNNSAAAKARAIQLAKPLLALGVIPMMLNKVTTGSIFGRSGTPIGAWDTGKDDDRGNRRIIDLAQLSGLRRGMRSTGIDAAATGLIQGKDANTTAGNAITDTLQSTAHPWLGPGLGFVAGTLTGRRLDLRGTMQAQKIPEGGAKQYGENARAALESQNPLVYGFLRPALQKAGVDQEPTKFGEGFKEGLGQSMASTVGVRSARPASSAAMDLARNLADLRYGEGFTPDEARSFADKQDVLKQIREKPENTGATVQQAVRDGKLSRPQARLLLEKQRTTPLKWAVRSLSGEQAMDVWDKANDAERSEIAQEITKKIAASKMSGKDKQAARSKVIQWRSRKAG